MKRPFHVLFILAAFAASLSHASEDVLAAGAVGSRWLNLPAAASVAALGGASVAQSTELGGLDVNPSGLAGIDNWQASFTHNLWIQGSSLERFALAMHSGPIGTLAFGFDYLSVGEIESVTLDPTTGVPVKGTNLHPSAMAVCAAWGENYGPVNVGVSFQTFAEELDGGRLSGIQGSVGGRYKMENGLRLGAAAQNVKLDSGPASRPMRVRTGLGYTYGRFQPLALDINADFPSDQGDMVWRAGGEWAFTQNF